MADTSKCCGHWQRTLRPVSVSLKGHDDERLLRTGRAQMSLLTSRRRNYRLVSLDLIPWNVMDKIILEMFPNVLGTRR